MPASLRLHAGAASLPSTRSPHLAACPAAPTLQVRIQPSQSKNKLFLGGIPHELTREDLFDLLSPLVKGECHVHPAPPPWRRCRPTHHPVQQPAPRSLGARPPPSLPLPLLALAPSPVPARCTPRRPPPSDPGLPCCPPPCPPGTLHPPLSARPG